MALRTIVQFPFTLTGSIDKPCLVQKFTVTFTSQTTFDSVKNGANLDVSGKGGGYVAAMKKTGTLEYQVWLVGFTGTRWAATDTVRLADGTPSNVGTCDADDVTDAPEDLGRYVNIINDDTAGGGANAVVFVGNTLGSATTEPKTPVQAKIDHAIIGDNSSYTAVNGTAATEISIEIIDG